MARSVELLRWRCGWTNWYVTLFCLKYFLSASGHSLLSIYTCGLNPRSVRYSCNFVVALMISSCDLFFIGSARIAFMSCANSTMTYFLPLLDVMGNLSVWSVNTLPDSSNICNVITFLLGQVHWEILLSLLAC